MRVSRRNVLRAMFAGVGLGVASIAGGGTFQKLLGEEIRPLWRRASSAIRGTVDHREMDDVWGKGNWKLVPMEESGVMGLWFGGELVLVDGVYLVDEEYARWQRYVAAANLHQFRATKFDTSGRATEVTGSNSLLAVNG